MKSDLPPAIISIAAEENEWQAVHIASHSERIYQVGRKATAAAGLIFYEREVEGSEVEHRKRLKTVEPKLISHEQALKRRPVLDAQWAERPILQGVIAGLWEQGKLHQIKDGVGGMFESGEVNDDDSDFTFPDYTLYVAADGAISLRSDNPFIHEEAGPLKWHEYILPRGTSNCKHHVRTADDKTELRTVMNGGEIVSHFKHYLFSIAQLSNYSA